MADNDIVRVLRLVEYIGPRDAVEEHVQKSIHGTKVPGRVAITAATIHEFAQAVEGREQVLMQQIDVLGHLLDDARAAHLKEIDELNAALRDKRLAQSERG